MYRWSATDGLALHEDVDLPRLTVGPKFVFLGAEDDRYLLGVAAYDGTMAARAGAAVAAPVRSALHRVLQAEPSRTSLRAIGAALSGPHGEREHSWHS